MVPAVADKSGEKVQTPAAPRPRETGVIQSKITVPPVSAQVVERPRLEQALAGLIETSRGVLVTATAGAGKTTAVAGAAASLGRPVAWLTVDRTDVAPGRLVTYLEAALGRQLPHVLGVATAAVGRGIPHAEAAGLLAEAIGEHPVALVLDDLERLGHDPDAWAVVEALVRYAPSSASVVLISRRDVPVALAGLPPGMTIAGIGEHELAFTIDEAAAALARAGKADVDAMAAVQATGGWVTGVLFEAWRSGEHVVGGGGEADPLFGYLSSHILGSLDARDRDFLARTSLLEEVTAPRAEALGLHRAGERLVALRAAHLPVAWSPDGHVMRCHSRFREYLIECAERLGSQELQALRLANAQRLAAEQLDEEATEEFLRAGAVRSALATAERSIMAVVDRVDLDIAERWLEALAQVMPPGASTFTTAELKVAAVRGDIRRGVRIADQLAALGELDRFVGSSEHAAWLIGLCYAHVGRARDVEAMLAWAEPGPVVDVVRYGLRALVDPPGAAPPIAPALTGSEVDTVIYLSDYVYGHFKRLLEAPASPLTEAVVAPFRIAALRATGHTERALELAESEHAGGPAANVLKTFIRPEILVDAGRRKEAKAALAEGRRLALESGTLAFQGFNAMVGAKLELRLDHDPAAARTALDRADSRSAATAFRVIQELRDTWYGYACLLEGDGDQALSHLRSAVASMVAADRILELPTAAVYLAEAEWRAGDEDAADRAADLALEAARRQGSNHVLLQALADVPAVASRRIDAEPRTDSLWHDVGRALIAQGVAVGATVAPSVQLFEFGRRALLVAGEEVRPRIAKTYELLSFLAARQPPQAERGELLDALFEGRADRSARSYLGQATQWLRQLLPAEAVIVEGGHVRLAEDIVVTTDSIRLESHLAEAARLQGEERLTATLQALAIYEQGDYLPGPRSTWADERAQRLADLAADARCQAADLALVGGRFELARGLTEQVLRAEPFREGAWRLAMRVAEALGDDQGILRAYHGCEQALAELGAVPSDTTRHLLRALRR